MNCKPGDLAVIVRALTQHQHIGKIVKVLHVADQFPDSWRTEPEFQQPDGRWIAWMDVHLRPIRDQPGNESFVTESRKSLPQPATAKGDTIDARGEIA